MMKTLAQTGNGWMNFKDPSNLKSNQTAPKRAMWCISSNLCTEILEVTSSNGETAVCNLGFNQSVPVHVVRRVCFDFEKLGRNVRTAVTGPRHRREFLSDHDRGKINNAGVGWFGHDGAGSFLQTEAAVRLERGALAVAKIQEEIYLMRSPRRAIWPRSWARTRRSKKRARREGIFQFELWNVEPTNAARWLELRTRMREVGLRNSLLIAIAPTATIASIVGCCESIEPQVSNIFKRETMSGRVHAGEPSFGRRVELKELELWNDDIRNRIKAAEGSIQDIGRNSARHRSATCTAPSWEIADTIHH